MTALGAGVFFASFFLSACTHPQARTDPETAPRNATTSDARTMEDMFAGRFPGLDVVRLPSGGITFRIRGISTIMGHSDPLIIVDGMELPAGDGLLSLNPDDIARIEVLKDSGSTSAYGIKGANGVIVITTKRAR
jgi:TonB-dependent SusC/RagA subfamily outer membrane receptor